MKSRLIKIAMVVAIVISTAFVPSMSIEKLSLDLHVRTLYQGKSVRGSGTLYYQTRGGKLITKMDAPLEQLVITTTTGEYKSYDFKDNTVMLMQGAEFSSRSSFVHQFITGQVTDMGLTQIGYKLTETKYQDNLVVNVYRAPSNIDISAQRAEIAYEDFLPIFIGFFDANGAPIQKTYYTNFQNVGYARMPFTITEIAFMGEADSSITQRIYSNLKLNGEVSNEWLNYEIPKDANIVRESDFRNIQGQ